MMRISGKSVLCAFALALLAAAMPALAAEVTRDSYREAVEPICKTNTEANERILKGVRKEVKQGKLKPAALSFEKAAKALRKTVRELKAVPQPPDDEARLSKWLKVVGEEASLFQTAGGQLRAGNKVAAQETVLRLTHNANKANNDVIPFEFRYCRLEPSKFT
jgi:phosphomevalonate kinase